MQRKEHLIYWLKKILAVTWWETDSLKSVIVVPYGLLVLPVQLILSCPWIACAMLLKKCLLCFLIFLLGFHQLLLSVCSMFALHIYLHSRDTFGFFLNLYEQEHLVSVKHLNLTFLSEHFNSLLSVHILFILNTNHCSTWYDFINIMGTQGKVGFVFSSYNSSLDTQ